MRPTSIASMMQSIAFNYSKKNQDVGLFEIANIYQDTENGIVQGNLPQETTILTIGRYGVNADFYKLKGIVENVLQQAGLVRYDIEKESNNPTFHPGRTANLKVGKDIIATLGEIHPIVLANYGVEEKVVVAVVDVDKLTKYGKTNKKYTPIAKFPSVQRDIAIVVDEEVEVGRIEKIIEKRAKKILENAKLFDVYRSEKLGNAKKSVAYSLSFRAMEKTLTDEEINVIMDGILTDLEKELGAELRK